jgi:hypothetical protein
MISLGVYEHSFDMVGLHKLQSHILLYGQVQGATSQLLRHFCILQQLRAQEEALEIAFGNALPRIGKTPYNSVHNDSMLL